MCKCLILVLWISVRLKSSLEEALASNREQASDFAKLQDELRKTRSSLQVWNFSNGFVMFIIFVVQYILPSTSTAWLTLHLPLISLVKWLNITLTLIILHRVD